jgi:hypothetical protein
MNLTCYIITIIIKSVSTNWVVVPQTSDILAFTHPHFGLSFSGPEAVDDRPQIKGLPSDDQHIVRVHTLALKIDEYKNFIYFCGKFLKNLIPKNINFLSIYLFLSSEKIKN